MKPLCAGMLLLVAIATVEAQAAVTFTVKGTNEFPAAEVPTGTPFSFSMTYDESVAGSPVGIFQTDFTDAIADWSLSVLGGTWTKEGSANGLTSIRISHYRHVSEIFFSVPTNSEPEGAPFLLTSVNFSASGIVPPSLTERLPTSAELFAAFANAEVMSTRIGYVVQTGAGGGGVFGSDTGLTVTPVPPAVLLLASALGAIGSLGMRRRTDLQKPIALVAILCFFVILCSTKAAYAEKIPFPDKLNPPPLFHNMDHQQFTYAWLVH